MRATGQAFAYNLGRGTSALFITGVALLAKSLPLSAAMATLAIASMACSIIATLFLPETAGRDLHSLGDADLESEAEGKQRRPVEQDAISAANTVG